ncbi:gliding motility-associated C-terminal domain-containing protein [Algibacter sp.]|uniref:T9SS type B sorting domain-containing protein n=1 Tax=Algibacter sp. TaxID=1872428 RepID=UPI003C72D1BA
MKTKPNLKNAFTYAFFYVMLFGMSYSGFSQCPTVTNPTPPPICDAAGLDYQTLTSLLVSDGVIIDNGATIVYYKALVGGTQIDNDALVKEGLIYVDDNNSGVDCSPRQELSISFTVPATNSEFEEFYCSDENPTVQTFIDDALISFIPSGGLVTVYNDFGTNDIASPTQAITSTTAFEIVFEDAGGCKSQLEDGLAIYIEKPDAPVLISPQSFCNAGGNVFTIADLDIGTATNIEWFNNPEASGSKLSLTTVIDDGDVLYALVSTSPFPCDSETTRVEVIIDEPFDPGTPGNDEFCDDSIPVGDIDMFPYLGGLPDTNGTWSGPTTITANPQGTTNISTLVAGAHTYIYTVPSNGTCPEGTSTVTITIYETYTSGTALSPASFCEAGLPSAFDLFTLLENHDPDGQWTEGTTSGGTVIADPMNLDLTSYTPATYNFTYTQNVLPNPCPEESTTVQVIVLQDPHAGNALNAVFCENELVSNYNLFDALDNTQDNNSGTWTDSSNTTISNPIDITSFTVAGSPYIFNYTIDNGTCLDTEAITITIEPAPESGTANTPVEFCEGSAPASFDLYSLIDGESGTGTWTNNTTSAIVTDPSNLDISSYTDGTYDFTFDIDPIVSCDDVDVVVSIIINPLPNTGTADNQTFCENNPALNNTSFDLFSLLLGSVDSGGQWYTGADNSGTAITNIIDLSVLGTGNNQYTYEVIDSNTCSNATTVAILIEPAPESGTANTPVEFCLAEITTGQTYNLFDLLEGEDQTGTWSDDDASLALSTNIVTLDGLSARTYNFTYDVDAIDGCDDVNVTVSIIVNDTPAPTADTPQEFCDTATVANLVATGTTIQWYDADTGGNLLDDTTALVDAQIYYATQTDATTGCESSVRTAVTATIYQTPDAGGPNATPIVACNDSTIDLTAGLDGTQDAGGTWYEGLDNTGTVIADPTMYDVTGFIGGNYEFTYYIVASAPCVDDSETITVTIEEPLNAGSNINPTLDICSNEGTTDLFTLLGGADAGGTWSPAMSSTTGVFDPLVDADGTYTYTLTNSCGTFTNQVEVTVTLAPNAGSDNTLAICVGDDPIDLFTLLGADAQSGGVWTPTLTSTTGVFDPAVDTSGTYTYTVTAVAPCAPDSTSDIVVTVSDTPAVIVLDPDPEFCLANNPTVEDLSISIRPSGTVNWYEDAALTIPALLTDDLVDGEGYYATQTSGACESSMAVQINVTVNDTPTPTIIDSTIEYCINDDPTIRTLSDNIMEYDNTSDNLRWYDTPTGGSAFSEDDLLTNITYYVALVDPVTGCESSVRLEVIPDLTACGKLIIPDGFSPNGDGVNDTFDVDNLAILFPNFEMEIYNRNGNIVYKGNANSPRFDGTSNQGRVISKGDLPVGVYFYIFNFNDGENKPEQGSLYLSR